MPSSRKRFAALCVPFLAGCTAAGGLIGARLDAAETRTRVVPVAEAGGIEKGTVVFATIAERETLKGAFRGESGRDLLIESDGKTERVPADSINELAAVIDAHAHRNAGMAIGLAIDLAVGAGAAWLWHERESHIVR